MRRIGICACIACSGFAHAEEEASVSGLKSIEEIVVVAHPLSGEGLSQATVVLQGNALQEKLATTIGETLSQEPGIRSAQFGKAVGRPVIHGLGGPRVRVMEDRIDTLDVSVTSADHATTIDPFIADRIEVLKGASSLLYGSGAIGGVVDVHTGRIPHDVPDKAFTGGMESRYDGNNEGTSTALRLDGGAGRWAWHVDGAWKDGDDYEIPGFAEVDEDDISGTLPGSFFDTESVAAGLSFVDDWGFVGVSLSRMEAEYGLPGGHAHHGEEDHDEADHEEEDHEEEHDEDHAAHADDALATPRLDMEQTRLDFELGVDRDYGHITSFNVRLGVNRYEHREIEPDGEVATRFRNDAWELRTEAMYETARWNGAVGLQHTTRKFSARGEEAFTPPVDTLATGLFWVGERQFAGLNLELGARIGRLTHDPDTGREARFTTFSTSAGLILPVGEHTRFSVVADLSSRAPVAEELYSDGPHLVTRAYEIGNPDLDNEQAQGLSATFEHQAERWSVSLTGYYNRFNDFIYESATGAEIDELPVFRFEQADATFYGLDAQASLEAIRWDAGALELRASTDLLKAELDVRGNDHLPRIPPNRYGLGLGLRHGNVRASVDYYRTDAQDDAAAFESRTAAYEDLQAYVEAFWNVDRARLALFAKGRNLTDDEQRLHTSFIKDFAPAPGRSVELGIRLEF